MSRISLPVSRTASFCSDRRAWVLLLVLPALGCVLGGSAALPAKRDGRAVYLEDCASCHGTSGRGDGPMAQALRERPADLTALAARSGGTFPRQSVREVITGARHVPAHEEREMPVWSDRFQPAGSGATVGATIFAESQLEDLLAYLASIQRSPGDTK